MKKLLLLFTVFALMLSCGICDKLDPKSNLYKQLCEKPGCTDQKATNYDPKANMDDESCTYPADAVLGCTDKKASNYNPKATKDDGSCLIGGCTDPIALNFNDAANTDDGSCRYDQVITDYNISVNDLMSLQKGMNKEEVLVITKLFPYEIYHNINNCEIHVYNYSVLLREFESDIEHKKEGLKDGEDVYSNERRQVLLYYRDGLLENIITEQSKSTIVNDILCFNEDLKSSCNTTDTYIKCVGCTDKEALNYNKQADLDDGSCEYPIVKGCTDVEALNYDEDAEEDNGSCEYCPCNYKQNPDYDPKRNCGERCIPEFDFIAGCMDKGAINFNPDATKEDNSCKYCPCDTEDYYYELNRSKNCKGDPCIKIKRKKEVVVDNNKDCSLCDFIKLNGKIGIELKTSGEITDNE